MELNTVVLIKTSYAQREQLQPKEVDKTGLEQCFSTNGTHTTGGMQWYAWHSWNLPPGSETTRHSCRRLSWGSRTPTHGFRALEKVLPPTLSLFLVFVTSHLTSQLGSAWWGHQCQLLLVVLLIGGPCEVVYQGTKMEKRWSRKLCLYKAISYA